MRCQFNYSILFSTSLIIPDYVITVNISTKMNLNQTNNHMTMAICIGNLKLRLKKPGSYHSKENPQQSMIKLH